MAAVNMQGMFLPPTVYSLYRTAMAILAIGVQTALILYGPDIK